MRSDHILIASIGGAQYVAAETHPVVSGWITLTVGNESISLNRDSVEALLMTLRMYQSKRQELEARGREL